VANVRVLVDSGADLVILPKSAALSAELDLARGSSRAVRFGGSWEQGLQLPVDMLVSGKRIRPDVVFVDKLLFPYGLLGRNGVFAQFNEISFIEKAKTPRVEMRW
jgi:hypothetical protein